MMRLDWIMPALGPVVAKWQESGENPALFCYLIAWGTYMSLRSRAFAPILVPVRHEAPCSNSSSICSIPSMM
jgi:hypothetical protein